MTEAELAGLGAQLENLNELVSHLVRTYAPAVSDPQLREALHELGTTAHEALQRCHGRAGGKPAHEAA